MQEFLVLGSVPGTNIQLTFTSWLCLVLVALLGALMLMHKNRVIMRTYRFLASFRARKALKLLNQYHLL